VPCSGDPDAAHGVSRNNRRPESPLLDDVQCARAVDEVEVGGGDDNGDDDRLPAVRVRLEPARRGGDRHRPERFEQLRAGVHGSGVYRGSILRWSAHEVVHHEMDIRCGLTPA